VEGTSSRSRWRCRAGSFLAAPSSMQLTPRVDTPRLGTGTAWRGMAGIAAMLTLAHQPPSGAHGSSVSGGQGADRDGGAPPDRRPRRGEHDRVHAGSRAVAAGCGRRFRPPPGHLFRIEAADVMVVAVGVPPAVLSAGQRSGCRVVAAWPVRLAVAMAVWSVTLTPRSLEPATPLTAATVPPAPPAIPGCTRRWPGVGTGPSGPASGRAAA